MYVLLILNSEGSDVELEFTIEPGTQILDNRGMPWSVQVPVTLNFNRSMSRLVYQFAQSQSYYNAYETFTTGTSCLSGSVCCILPNRLFQSRQLHYNSTVYYTSMQTSAISFEVGFVFVFFFCVSLVRFDSFRLFFFYFLESILSRLR